MEKLASNYLIFSLIWVVALSSCTTLDPGVYGRQRQAAAARYDAQAATYQAEGYRAQERIADSKADVSKHDAEQVVLDRIKTVAAGEVANVSDTATLQKKLKELRNGWPEDSYGQNSQRRRMVRLYVTNQSKNYVVRFAEPPFDAVGELGPGETSDFPVTVREGSLTLRYFEFETELGRDSFYGGRERNIPIFIQEGRTKPITIKNR